MKCFSVSARVRNGDNVEVVDEEQHEAEGQTDGEDDSDAAVFARQAVAEHYYRVDGDNRQGVDCRRYVVPARNGDDYVLQANQREQRNENVQHGKSESWSEAAVNLIARTSRLYIENNGVIL